MKRIIIMLGLCFSFALATQAQNTYRHHASRHYRHAKARNSMSDNKTNSYNGDRRMEDAKTVPQREMNESKSSANDPNGSNYSNTHPWGK